jgi:hypothetical protein
MFMSSRANGNLKITSMLNQGMADVATGEG